VLRQTERTLKFSATIHWAQIDLGLDDHNHLVDPADLLAAALRHQ